MSFFLGTSGQVCLLKYSQTVLSWGQGQESHRETHEAQQSNVSGKSSGGDMTLEVPTHDSAATMASQPSTLSDEMSPNGKPPPAPSTRVSIGIGNGVGRHSDTATGIAYAKPRRIHPNAARQGGGSAVKMGTGSNPLESFFPFDPCLLELVHQYVGPHYRRWMGVPGIDVDAKYPCICHSSIVSDSQDMQANRPSRTGTLDSTAGSGEDGDELSSEVDLQGLDSHHAEYSHQGKVRCLLRARMT